MSAIQNSFADKISGELQTALKKLPGFTQAQKKTWVSKLHNWEKDVKHLPVNGKNKIVLKLYNEKSGNG